MLLDRSCDDVHDASSATLTELDRACIQGEQCIVLATTNTLTGVEVGAALTNDDFACLDNLTAEALYTQVLSV
ncbi:hypothetical protein AOC05_07975 [Arthrobacter alpinus]|uniref:Uncharacterized protein n=1 Tax=Arthrobacter alpinus TaxID=656366 RepID=A0A0M4QMF9_9MICC|nr:hypothetical protein AOC05_07975 [Arthrobacter alpinus]